MSPLVGNLFTVLTLIVAPAVLTNASSILALNTANRFGRVIDRARQLAKELEGNLDPQTKAVRLRQFAALSKRGILLMRAQTCFYGALGLFVAAALISVVGAGLTPNHPLGYRIAAACSLGVGLSAALSLVYGCGLVVRETRLALVNLHDEAGLIEIRAGAPGSTGASGLPLG